MRYKKLLLSLAVLIGSFSIGSIYQNTVHADYPSNYEYDPEFDATQDAKYGSDAVENSFENEYGLESASKKRYYEREHTQELINKSGYGIPKSEREKLDSEKPLSQVYPNGATVERNGKIKVNHEPKKYKVMGHWVDYKVYKYYKKEQHNLKPLKDKVNKEDAEYKAAKDMIHQGKRARAYDIAWVKNHSYNNNNMKISKYSKLSAKHYERAYILNDLSRKIGLTNSYKIALRYAKSKKKRSYRFIKVIRPLSQPVYAKVVNSNYDIYKIKLYNHHYYYTPDAVGVHYYADLEPYNTCVLGSKRDRFVNSDFAPNSKEIVLKPGTKFQQNMSWDQNNDKFTIYYLKGKTWKIDSINSPKWTEEL